MSMHSIYIEVSDEITTVVERLKNVPEETVALVVPKGAILLQSIVNLKLVKKAAADVSKQIVLITTDKIGRNLAVQLGIPVTANERDAESALAGNAPEGDVPEGEEPKVIAGVRIHRYYDEKDDSAEDAKAAEPIIIPKTMMQEAKAEEAVSSEPIEVPPALPAAAVAAEEVASSLPSPTPSSSLDPVVLPSEPLKRTTISTTSTAPETPTAAENDKKKAAVATAAASSPEDFRRKRILLFSLFLAGLLVIGGLATSFLFLPVTAATITVPAESWTQSLEFTASTAASVVSEDNKTLPAELITGEASETLNFKATGTKKVGEAATGTATLYNYDTTTSQTLPAGSKIIVSSRNFTTQTTVTVPGFSQSLGGVRTPGTATVAIVADEVGGESNFNEATANDITGPGIKLSAKVTSSGGSSKDVTVISATDIANAKTALSEKLRSTAKTAIDQQLENRDPRFSEEADSFTLNDFTVTASSGTEAESADVSGKGVLRRFIVNYEQLRSATENRVRTAQGQNKKIIFDSLELTSFKVNPELNQAVIVVDSKGKESVVIPEEALRRNLAGKSVAAGQALVETTIPNSSLTITRKPQWWPSKRFPYSPKFLSLSVQYE